MQITRTEIRTGLLVVLSLAALVAVLLYLGAPGVFIKQSTYKIYFDNAGGISPGADVLLAGRKIGYVAKVFSPVPEAQRPDPKMEVLVEVRVAADSLIYNNVQVQMVQNSLLGEMVIDFNSGNEAVGLAPDGTYFRGERQPGLADAVPQVLERIDPALKKITSTLGTLEITSANLNKLTAEEADLPRAFAEFRKFGVNLNEISGPDGALRKSLANIETLTAKDGRIDQTVTHIQDLTDSDSPLSRTLRNAEKFTSDLANSKDVQVTLQNFRQASEKLNRTVNTLGPQLSTIGRNLEQASDTVRKQPWRLIWPTTKKYEEERLPPPQPRLKVQTRKRKSG